MPKVFGVILNLRIDSIWSFGCVFSIGLCEYWGWRMDSFVPYLYFFEPLLPRIVSDECH